jgi:hypothetical protein
MPKRSSMRPRRPRDVNSTAASIVESPSSDGSALPRELSVTEAAHMAAVALGRLGGRKGGPARAKSLSKKRRAEIASKAAKARWSDR